MARDRSNTTPADTNDGLPANNAADGTVISDGATTIPTNPAEATSETSTPTVPVDDSMLPVEKAAKQKKAASGEATVGDNKADERFVFVIRPGSRTETNPEGERVKRSDYIKELWRGDVTSNNPSGQKFSRGAIARHLTTITGKKTPYQIAFAATKGVAGGPAKESGEGEVTQNSEVGGAAGVGAGEVGTNEVGTSPEMQNA